jgi:hypothetical protein
MKSFFRISSKQVLFAAALTVLVFSILFLQDKIVQGKGTAVTTTPLGAANLTLTKVSSNYTGAEAVLTTTSGPDGSFTFQAPTPPQKGFGKVVYTLTVTQPITYTVTDSKSSGPKATPVIPPPVNVSVTFNQLNGLTVGNSIANTGPIGPFTFMSNTSLEIALNRGGAVSGKVTKQ